MKKFLSTLLLIGIILSINTNVFAACAQHAVVGGESLCTVEGSTSKNTAGTAYVEDGILVLNNYNGGNISFTSGVGNANGLKIKLIGENYITNQNGYGILSYVNGINFIGDGSLTITSLIPFAAYDANSQKTEIADSYKSNTTLTTIKIVSGNYLNNDDQTIEEQTEEKDVFGDENNGDNSEKYKLDLSLIICIASIIICATCIIIVFMQTRKIKQNSEKE